MILSYYVQNRYNYDVTSWRSIKIRLLQTVIFAQKLENVESSNREQEKLTPHTSGALNEELLETSYNELEIYQD